MKKFASFICMLFIAATHTNCSSVKVLDTWKSDSVSELDNNFLVLARTSNNQARIAFESEIANQMRATGKKATESYSKFPKVNFEKEMTDERKQMIRDVLKNEGFDGVVLSVIKDYQESTRVQEDGGYYAGGFYPNMYPGYYHTGGFYGYFYHPMAYSTYGSYVPSTTTVSTVKTYVLETVAYNLKADKENQLVAVVTTQIEDPQSVTKVASEYVKKITKAFQK